MTIKKYCSDGKDPDQGFVEPTGILVMLLIWQRHKNNQYQINEVPEGTTLLYLMKIKWVFKKHLWAMALWGFAPMTISPLAWKVREVANEKSKTICYQSVGLELCCLGLIINSWQVLLLLLMKKTCCFLNHPAHWLNFFKALGTAGQDFTCINIICVLGFKLHHFKLASNHSKLANLEG